MRTFVSPRHLEITILQIVPLTAVTPRGDGTCSKKFEYDHHMKVGICLTDCDTCSQKVGLNQNLICLIDGSQCEFHMMVVVQYAQLHYLSLCIILLN